MRNRRFFLTLCVLACCLMLLFLSGCLPWAMFVKETEPENGKTAVDVKEEAEPEISDAVRSDTESTEAGLDLSETVEPYYYHEFGLESLGLSKNIEFDEVVAILGDPVSVEMHEGMGPHTTFYYDGFALSFDQGLQYFDLYTPSVISARGIRVGDPVETVLSSYLQENEVPNLWVNPEAESWPDYDDRCIELYYFEPDDEGLVKTGIVYCDELTGASVKITYSHYLPFSCGYSGITYLIEDGVVVEIKRSGF